MTVLYGRNGHLHRVVRHGECGYPPGELLVSSSEHMVAQSDVSDTVREYLVVASGEGDARVCAMRFAPSQLIVGLSYDLNNPMKIRAKHKVAGMLLLDRDHVRRLEKGWNVPGVYLLLDRLDSEGRWGAYVGKASIPGSVTGCCSSLRIALTGTGRCSSATNPTRTRGLTAAKPDGGQA
ncbi:hypothetical protein [Nonomuraea sp. KM88]|uniref:hypothetical protein n=1 Tax=Nonomuraea sp. KM88 TaxID=3457427 RepID=UPI003FCEE226